MTLTFTLFSVFDLIRPQRQPADAQTSPKLEQLPKIDDAGADRAFLHELMCHSPEGIQSEFGLMAMMSQFPMKF